MLEYMTSFLKQRIQNYIADSWTFGIPKQYSVMDIDGDGTDELLIYGSEDLWEDLAIFPSIQIHNKFH